MRLAVTAHVNKHNSASLASAVLHKISKMLTKEFSLIALALLLPELVKCASNVSNFNASSTSADTMKSFSSIFMMSLSVSSLEEAQSPIISASAEQHTTNVFANLATSTASLNSPSKGDISSILTSPSTSNSVFQVPSTTVNGTLQYFDGSTVMAHATGSITAGFIATSPVTTSTGHSLNTGFSSSGLQIARETSSYTFLIWTLMSLPLSSGLSTVASPTLSPVLNPSVPSFVPTLSPSSSTFHSSVKRTMVIKTEVMASEQISAVAETSITNTKVTISSSEAKVSEQVTRQRTLSTSVYSSTPISNAMSNPISTPASAKPTYPISPRTPTKTSKLQITSSLTTHPSFSMRTQEHLSPSGTATLPFSAESSSTRQTSLIIVSPVASLTVENTSIPADISLQATHSVTMLLETTEVIIINSEILTPSPSMKLKQTSTITVSITEISSYVPALHSSSYVPTPSQALPSTKKPPDNKNETIIYVAIGGGAGAFIMIIVIISCCVFARTRNGRAKSSIKLNEGEEESVEKIDWNLKWSTMRQNDVFSRKPIQMTVYGEANGAFLTDLDEKNNPPSAFLDLSGNGAHEDTNVDENSNDDALLRCRTFSGSGNRSLNGGQSLLDVVKQKRKSREIDADITEEVFEDNEQPNETVNVDDEPKKSRKVKQSSFGSFTGNQEPSKTGPSLSFVEDSVPKHSSFSEDKTVSLASGKSGSIREIDENDHCEELNNQNKNTESQLEETPNENLGSQTERDAGTEPKATENAITEQGSISGSTETSLISDKAVTPAESSQDARAPDTGPAINISGNEQNDIDKVPSEMKEGAGEIGKVSLQNGTLPVQNLEREDAEKRLSEYYC